MPLRRRVTGMIMQENSFRHGLIIGETGIMMMKAIGMLLQKTMTMSGKCPYMQARERMYNERGIYNGDNSTQRMEMYGPDPKTGKEFKMMK